MTACLTRFADNLGQARFKAPLGEVMLRMEGSCFRDDPRIVCDLGEASERLGGAQPQCELTDKEYHKAGSHACLALNSLQRGPFVRTKSPLPQPDPALLISKVRK